MSEDYGMLLLLESENLILKISACGRHLKPDRAGLQDRRVGKKNGPVLEGDFIHRGLFFHRLCKIIPAFSLIKRENLFDIVLGLGIGGNIPSIFFYGLGACVICR